MMRRLPIDWIDLESAFESSDDDFGDGETNYYLQLDTGKVIFVDGHISDLVERVNEELDESEPECVLEAVRQSETFGSLTDLEQPNVLAAIEMNEGSASSYAEIPKFSSDDDYDSMEEFIGTVKDGTMQDKLRKAINARRPFRNFHDVLSSDRRLERQWREFESDRNHQTMLEWLHGMGIEPTDPPREIAAPPLPDLRNIMLDEVKWFVQAARRIDGVSKISLIGSLTTNKEFPKDVDLLVVVSDSCDLTELASLGRKLSGHLNANRAGADVFLIDNKGDYLGRTCPWRNCGPGYRVSCDAEHCGRRPFLHDDHSSIRLDPEIVDNPPVDLWPAARAADSVPQDVHERLIRIAE